MFLRIEKIKWGKKKNLLRKQKGTKRKSAFCFMWQEFYFVVKRDEIHIPRDYDGGDADDLWLIIYLKTFFIVTSEQKIHASWKSQHHSCVLAKSHMNQRNEQ